MTMNSGGTLSSDEMRLVVNGIRKTYAGGFKALDGVSLDVGPGLFGLLGANGAGKSSLMNILASLLRPDSGTIHLGTLDALADPTAMRRQVGYLPQEFGVYPRLSAVILLDQLARLKGIFDPAARARHVAELLELVNLTEARDRAVDSYSGGMRRRFGVAQALIGWPPLVIVDEPTAGLDPVERNRFQHVLNDIAERAIVILSTHIIEDIESLCRTCAIMDRGCVIAAGTPAGLVDALRGRLWQRTGTRSELAQVMRADDVIAVQARQNHIRVVLMADNNPGAEFVPLEPGLEDVFFASRAKPEAFSRSAAC